MTDQTRLRSNWELPFLNSRNSDISLDNLKDHCVSSSNRSSPFFPPLSQTFASSPSHQLLVNPPSSTDTGDNSNTTARTSISTGTSTAASTPTVTTNNTGALHFQPFDPFSTDNFDATKDTDLDELSNLLSRQFLEDVDAEITSKVLSDTTIKPTAATFTPNVTTPWRVENNGKPWSPLLSATHEDKAFPAMTNNKESLSAATWWDRFEPYANDSEFDPTLQFYHGNHVDNHIVDGLLSIPSVTTATITTPTAAAPVSPLGRVEEITTNQNAAGGETLPQNQQDTNIRAVALIKLSTLFPDRDEKELGQTLATFDYDVERTIEALLAAKSTSPPTAVDSHAASLSPSTAHTSKTTVTVGSPRKRQVCRHYLAGQCYRKDCWFAHDLEVKPCKFWLQGSCLKGDTCEFAHTLEDFQMENVVKYSTLNDTQTHQQQKQQQKDQQQQQHEQLHQFAPTVADFPVLIARPNRKSKKYHNKKSFKK